MGKAQKQQRPAQQSTAQQPTVTPETTPEPTQPDVQPDAQPDTEKAEALDVCLICFPGGRLPEGTHAGGCEHGSFVVAESE